MRGTSDPRIYNYKQRAAAELAVAPEIAMSQIYIYIYILLVKGEKKVNIHRGPQWESPVYILLHWAGPKINSWADHRAATVSTNRTQCLLGFLYGKPKSPSSEPRIIIF